MSIPRIATLHAIQVRRYPAGILSPVRLHVYTCTHTYILYLYILRHTRSITYTCTRVSAHVSAPTAPPPSPLHDRDDTPMTWHAMACLSADLPAQSTPVTGETWTVAHSQHAHRGLVVYSCTDAMLLFIYTRARPLQPRFTPFISSRPAAVPSPDENGRSHCARDGAQR